ncbi:MAG: hypothetical protein ACE148_11365 [Vicinamibacterales bacterium]
MRERLQSLLGSILLLVALSSAASCSGSPTEPSELGPSQTIGSVTVEALSASYWRDFMPIVQKPGPDGGSPLTAAVTIRVTNGGPASTSFVVSGAIRDSENASHAMTASATDRRTGLPWSGVVLGQATLEINVSLRDGPFLPVGSRVFAVITLEDVLRRSISIRAPEGEIRATF